jgi:hypothetical protein
MEKPPSGTVSPQPQTDTEARLDHVRRDLDNCDTRRAPSGLLLIHTPEQREDALAWGRQLKRGSDDDVLEAVTAFGLPVLHPKVDLGDESADWALAGLQTLVWKRVTTWYGLARQGRTCADQKRGVRLLQRLGTALGRRKGRPTLVARDVAMHLKYKSTKRRLEGGRKLLKKSPNGVSATTWLVKVAEACRVPQEALRATNPDGNPTSVRDEALALVAEEYGLDVGRVANICRARIAPKGKRRSRKG